MKTIFACFPRASAILLLILTVAPRPTDAQSQQTSPSSPPTDSTAGPDHAVNLIFSVTSHRDFVKDLKREQFTVLDNKRPPKNLLAFEAETALPLRLGLLLDASNSVRNHFGVQQQAAVKFLEQSIRSNKDQAFVVGFNERAAIAQDFTNDASQLAKGVMAIRPGEVPLFGTPFTMFLERG